MISEDQIDSTKELYDIYGMSHTPWWQHIWLYYFAITCLLLLLISIIWYAIRKIVAKKRVYTAWDKAIIELDRLQIQGFVSVVYSKELYTALTKLLKAYVYERYGFDIIGKTDDEAIAFLEKNYFPADILEQLRTIFSGSVIIKFSNAYAIKAQIEQDFSASRTIIYKTIPHTK